MSSGLAWGGAAGLGRMLGYAVTSLFLHFSGSLLMLKIRRYAKWLNLRHCAERVNELSSVDSQRISILPFRPRLLQAFLQV